MDDILDSGLEAEELGAQTITEVFMATEFVAND